MTEKSNSLGELKLFIAKTLNEESDSYSKLVNSLDGISTTDSGADALKILLAIHKAKIELLHKIFAEASKV